MKREQGVQVRSLLPLSRISGVAEWGYDWSKSGRSFRGFQLSVHTANQQRRISHQIIRAEEAHRFIYGGKVRAFFMAVVPS